MTKLLLSVHVLAAILVVGPIAVAASLFPRYARPSASREPDGRAAGVAALLHRICRGYAVAGMAVPVFGIATGAELGVLTDIWLIVSLGLTAAAAAVLVLAILPAQKSLLALPPETAADQGRHPLAIRLTALTGIFNLLWAVVVVLMIVRPGSTTGA
ncbi:hypothetical protein [Streptomyces sp. SP18CS02]|uniref:hypothetical protein n=1 Tax=Streptomyces sp. SP18CS02 TaxID=3002531 RepID=UPI002E79E0B4|nr:hypothetical protein [Streptomyces sp. SP18CS02]MEE1751570.1 hypothetical protein [Streptomyces sp. SP18CS02]